MYLHFLSCMNYPIPLLSSPFISPSPPPPPHHLSSHLLSHRGPEAKQREEVSSVTQGRLGPRQVSTAKPPPGDPGGLSTLWEEGKKKKKTHTHTHTHTHTYMDTARQDYHTHAHSETARGGGNGEVNEGKRGRREERRDA